MLIILNLDYNYIFAVIYFIQLDIICIVTLNCTAIVSEVSQTECHLWLGQTFNSRNDIDESNICIVTIDIGVNMNYCHLIELLDFCKTESIIS